MNVLIVHPEEDFLKLIRIYLTFLKLNDLHIHTARSISESKNIIPNLKSLDLVICDSKLSDGNFEDLETALLASQLQTAYVVFSVEEVDQDILSRKKNFCSIKKNDYPKLLAEIKRVLQIR